MKDWHTLPAGASFIASFSGGKDSTLAIYEAIKSGRCLGLIVMFDESGCKSGAHGLKKHFFEMQAASMGLPVFFGTASWADYEKVFTGLLAEARAMGAEFLVTGDLDVPEENCWHEKTAANAGLKLYLPLWGRDHAAEPLDFTDAGFRSVTVCVNTEYGMHRSDLGRVFDRKLVAELIGRGIDPSAEAGEFHTAAFAGPLFKKPLRLIKSDVRQENEYYLLDIDAQW